MSAPVEVRGLRKRYGAIAAVDGVDLTVEAGDVYGYLGPNGAGKTTTLRMILGLIRRDEGEINLFGRDPARGIDALAPVAGFVESPAFYPYLSGRDNLRVLAQLDGGRAGDAQIDATLDQVGLLDRARDKVGGYSLGMRQRLGIASSLIRDPKLLVLDEPANGLDPAGIRDMRTLVGRLHDEGVTILYSSHLLAEVEEVCNRVAIVDGGRIAFEGTLADLRGSFGEAYRLETSDDDAASRIAGPLAHREGGVLHIDAALEDVDRLSIELGRAGIAIRTLVREERSLEDLFFRLTEGE